MQIQLRQPEIVEAIQQYIVRQGLNLSNKTITVSFTAGRGGSGVSADIAIEDSGIPAFQEEMNLELKPPALSVVAPAIPTPEPTPDAEEDPSPTPPPKSLFG
jgi:hypothetical protein